MSQAPGGVPLVLPPDALDRLIAKLAATHDVIGPRVQDSSLTYGPISRLADLPKGVGAEQTPGQFRLVPSGRGAYFDYTFGAQSAKGAFSPAVSDLFTVRRENGGYKVTHPPEPARPLAIIGLRPCELAAIAIQDRVYLQGLYVDAAYQARRKGAMLIAVNCARPSASCFCVSMKTGPVAKAGYDISLTEILEGADHYFLARAGTQSGMDALAGLGLAPAGEGHIAAAEAVAAEAVAAMDKTLNMIGLKETLAASYDNPRWAKTGARCLSCGSCAAVCPTCFCLKFEESTDLAGAAIRRRGWDICLTQDYSYIHGGAVRPSAAARYRHFVIHKLSGWVDQFGTPGCVGCGRCSVWCPAGIDIVEEASAVAAPAGGGS